MLLGLELPSLNWSERLRLVGLASVTLLVSNLNILALKVIMMVKMVLNVMMSHILSFCKLVSRWRRRVGLPLLTGQIYSIYYHPHPHHEHQNPQSSSPLLFHFQKKNYQKTKQSDFLPARLFHFYFQFHNKKYEKTKQIRCSSLLVTFTFYFVKRIYQMILIKKT